MTGTILVGPGNRSKTGQVPMRRGAHTKHTSTIRHEVGRSRLAKVEEKHPAKGWHEVAKKGHPD